MLLVAATLVKQFSLIGAQHQQTTRGLAFSELGEDSTSRQETHSSIFQSTNNNPNSSLQSIRAGPFVWYPRVVTARTRDHGGLGIV